MHSLFSQSKVSTFRSVQIPRLVQLVVRLLNEKFFVRLALLRLVCKFYVSGNTCYSFICIHVWKCFHFQILMYTKFKFPFLKGIYLYFKGTIAFKLYQNEYKDSIYSYDSQQSHLNFVYIENIIPFLFHFKRNRRLN